MKSGAGSEMPKGFLGTGKWGSKHPDSKLGPNKEKHQQNGYAKYNSVFDAFDFSHHKLAQHSRSEQQNPHNGKV